MPKHVVIYFANKYHNLAYIYSCVSVADIYLTISLSTHNGDDTPQN